MQKLTSTTSTRLLTACLSLLAAVTLSAQETEATPLAGDLDFLSVKDVKLQTTAILQDNSIVYWNEDALHAGVQSFTFTIFNNKEIPKDFEEPMNPATYFNILDMNGTEVAKNGDDLTQLFKRIKFTKNFSSLLSCSATVKRGGEYQVKAGLSPDLYIFEKSVVLAEEAGMQVSNTSMLVDSLLVPKVYITSGYPYNPEEIAGEKYLRWSLTSANNPTQVIAEAEQKFELLSEIPTLAAIAEIDLEIPELQPGEYLLALVSDYAPANRNITLYVKDVLDVDITLDKEEYTLGADKDMTMQIEMRYGYPYIQVDQETNQPTVTVIVNLLGEKTTETFSNDAWDHSEMNCSGTIKVGLDNITKEVIEEYSGNIPMSVSVIFNDATQYYAALDIPFVTDESGIESVIEENGSIKASKLYNVFGIEVDDSYKGLVITSDGKKFVRLPL